MSVTRLKTVAYLLKKVGQSEKWSKILDLLGLSLVHDFSKSIISRTAGPKNFLRGFLESAMNSVQDRLKNKKWKKFFRQVDLSRGRFSQKVTLKTGFLDDPTHTWQSENFYFPIFFAILKVPLEMFVMRYVKLFSTCSFWRQLKKHFFCSPRGPLIEKNFFQDFQKICCQLLSVDAFIAYFTKSFQKLRKKYFSKTCRGRFAINSSQ